MISTLKASKSTGLGGEGSRMNSNRMTFTAIPIKTNLDSDNYTTNSKSSSGETKQSKFFNKFRNRLSNRRSTSTDITAGHEISQPTLVGHQNAQQIIANLAKDNVTYSKPLPEIKVQSEHESGDSTDEESVQVVIRAERVSQVCHLLPQSENNDKLSKSIPANFAATLILNSLPPPPTPNMKVEAVGINANTLIPVLPKRNPSRMSHINQLKTVVDNDPIPPTFLHARSKSSPFVETYNLNSISSTSSSSSNTPSSLTSTEGFNLGLSNKKTQLFLNSNSDDDLCLTQLAELNNSNYYLNKKSSKGSDLRLALSSEEESCACDRDDDFKKLQQELIRLKLQNNLLARELSKTKRLLVKVNKSP